MYFVRIDKYKRHLNPHATIYREDVVGKDFRMLNIVENIMLWFHQKLLLSLCFNLVLEIFLNLQ